MSTITCAEVEELLGAYALRALPAAEMADVELHLLSCLAHPEMRHLVAAARALNYAPLEMKPPAHLKARLMAAVREEGALAPPVTQTGSGWLRRLLSRPTGPYALAGALAVLVAALLVWNISLQSGDSQRSARLVSAPGADISGQVLILEQQGLAVLEASGLAPLPEGQVYQAWTIMDGAPTSAGLLTPTSDGSVHSLMSVDAGLTDRIAVTVEPAGGSLQPTTVPVATADI